jgi:hypothetical protein
MLSNGVSNRSSQSKKFIGIPGFDFDGRVPLRLSAAGFSGLETEEKGPAAFRHQIGLLIRRGLPGGDQS